MNALNAVKGVECSVDPSECFGKGKELVQRTVTELMVKDFGGNLVRCVCSVSSHPVHSITK